MDATPFGFKDVIYLIVYAVTISGLYWKLRMSDKELNFIKFNQAAGVAMEKEIILIKAEFKEINEKLDTIIKDNKTFKETQDKLAKVVERIETKHEICKIYNNGE